MNTTICEDININHLDDDNTNKQKLDSLLATSNLFSITDFPARINNISMTAIDNSFIDKYRNKNFTINPLPNGLSDHYAQVLVFNNTNIQNPFTYPIIRRNINKFTISEFKLHLIYKSWDNVFYDDKVNTVLHNFLSTYQRIFYHSLPLKKYIYIHNQNNKTWITAGIKESCIHKRKIHMLSRNTKNPEL